MSEELTTREYVVRSVAGMRLASAFSSTVSGPVLHLVVHTVFTPAKVISLFVICGLPSVNNSSGHIHRQSRIFTKRDGDTFPAWFRSQVHLSRDLHGYTHCQPLLRHQSSVFA